MLFDFVFLRNVIFFRARFHHLQHGKPAGGAVKDLVGRLSIAVVVILYVLFLCCLGLLAMAVRDLHIVLRLV